MSALPIAARNERIYDILHQERFITLGGMTVRTAVFHQVRMQPGALNTVHTHACHELSFVRDGSIDYLSAGERAVVRKNGCFFLPPFKKHHWETPRGALVDGFMLDIGPADNPALAAIAARAAELGFSLSVPPEAVRLFSAIDDELAANAVFTAERVSLMVRDILLLILRGNFSDAFTRPRPQGLPAAKTREEQLFFMARSFIDAHRTEAITLADVAKHLSVTPRYVNRIFSAFVDVPCGRYIQEQKLWDAFTMLKMRPAMKIREVAHACGWRDYMYFTRAFTKKFLSSPKKVRASVFV